MNRGSVIFSKPSKIKQIAAQIYLMFAVVLATAGVYHAHNHNKDSDTNTHMSMESENISIEAPQLLTQEINNAKKQSGEMTITSVVFWSVIFFLCLLLEIFISHGRRVAEEVIATYVLFGGFGFTVYLVASAF